MTDLKPNGHYADEYRWTITAQPTSRGWEWLLSGPEGTYAWIDPDATPEAMGKLMDDIGNGVITTETQQRIDRVVAMHPQGDPGAVDCDHETAGEDCPDGCPGWKTAVRCASCSGCDERGVETVVAWPCKVVRILTTGQP